MFFIPAAIFAGVDGITWWDAIHNWIFAFLGNLVGATIFVAGAYWFLYARGERNEPGDEPHHPGESGRDGRIVHGDADAVTDGDRADAGSRAVR
jgi:hypothetical protein